MAAQGQAIQMRVIRLHSRMFAAAVSRERNAERRVVGLGRRNQTPLAGAPPFKLRVETRGAFLLAAFPAAPIMSYVAGGLSPRPKACTRSEGPIRCSQSAMASSLPCPNYRVMGTLNVTEPVTERRLPPPWTIEELDKGTARTFCIPA
jgi:hypothetical protein